MISSLELAKLCGVSQGTVDRALHGRKGISEKTRTAIMAKAQEYGYLPNPAAREILSGRASAVAALIPDLQSPFFMDMLSAVKRQLKARDLRLIITTINDREEMLAMLADFAARRYTAAIVIPPEEGIVLPKRISGFKVVSLLSPCMGDCCSFISPDEVKMGETATRYLIDRGYQKIVHIAPERQSLPVRSRIEGYRNIMLANNLVPVVRYGIEVADIIELAGRKDNSAFFCHNDWLALSVIRIVESSGIAVPDRVSVIGVDNSPTFTSLYPDITTVEYPMAWLASEVVNNITGVGGDSVCAFSDFKVITRKTVS